jgi:transposase, IS5 family
MSPGEVYADLAYARVADAPEIRAAGGPPCLPGRGVWALAGDSAAWARREAGKAQGGRVRRRIETVFGTWTRSHGLRRMRWRGRAKAALQVRLTAMAYNLRRARAIVRATAAGAGAESARISDIEQRTPAKPARS